MESSLLQYGWFLLITSGQQRENAVVLTAIQKSFFDVVKEIELGLVLV